MKADRVVNGRFLSRRVTGVERYSAEILRRLPSRVRVVRPHPGALGPAGHAWEQLILPLHVSPRSVLWSPANTGPLLVSGQVLTLHDLSPLEHAEWFRSAFSAWYRLFLPLLVRRVRRVLADSEHVRRKILSRFRLPPERVVVVPCGVDLDRFHPQAGPPGLGCYVLFVGSLQPRKNLPALLAAWDVLQDRFPGVSLVIAGDSGPVFRPPSLSGRLDRVLFTGYVPDRELPALYAGARVFVLPSLDEGFGLTALEAMACGTPVLASNAGALPEVVGSAGLLFDPHDPSTLAEGLERCLSEPRLRRSLSAQGLERARRCSWSAAAERVWQVLGGEDAS